VPLFTVQIFLSHATSDQELVNQVKSAVGSLATVYCTEDDGRAGVNVHAKIQREIDKSDVVIALLTPSADASPYVHQELGWAQRAHKLIIPLVSSEVPRDHLGMLQGVEYIRIDGDRADGWVGRLSGRIDALVRRNELENTSVGILLIVLGILLLADN
jgi:TIR domain